MWRRFAGALLLLDGVAALVLFLISATFSLFPPVAAIEGRASPDQSQWGLAVASLGLAVAGLWAGQRALRRIRRGRLVGVAVATAAAALLGWWIAIPGMSIEAIAVLGALLAAQVAAAAVLLVWPGGAKVPAGP